MSLKERDTVTWTSQSGGFTKTKIGTILTIVPPYQSAYINIPKEERYTNRVKAQDVSNFERAIVTVPRGGKSKIVDYYIPRLSVLKKV